jgi:hypothetical protein
MAIITGTLLSRTAVANTLDAPENRTGTMMDFIAPQYSFADGVGAGQNNLVWSDRRRVLAGDTDTITISAGLLNVFNEAVAFAVVTAIVVYNRNAVAGDIITYGPAVAQPFLGPFGAAADLVNVAPEGCFMIWNDTGWAVAAGASDQVAIIETGGVNPVDYDILILGRDS